MKLWALCLIGLLAVVCMTGCKKAAVEYKAKDQAETAVMAFAKQKVPNMVITEVKKMEMPVPPAPAGTVAPGGAAREMPAMPSIYMVTLAKPDDASMGTIATVSYDEKAGKVLDNVFANPPPIMKMKKR